MRRILTVLAIVIGASVGISQLGIGQTEHTSAQQVASGISPEVMDQIAAVLELKRGLTAAQQKMDSNLVLAEKVLTGELSSTQALQGVAGAVDLALDPQQPPITSLLSAVAVDIYGSPSSSITASVAAAGGTVIYASDRWGIVRASLPLGLVEQVAENADVKSIQRWAQATTNVGALTSQGYVSHTAREAVNSGYTGIGVTVGVLSDSASAARLSALITSGDLAAGGTGVLAGQAGTGTDEGAAMMEIVHDIAPGANLIFATANGGQAQFANNILALQAAGASVIVDDITYFAEGAFQDGPIARAVNQVTAAGVNYFSSAANSGSVTWGTSGTWEGDFVNGGPITGPIAGAGETGFVHNFGGQLFDSMIGPSRIISLKWSDPLGGSSNDYDLFVLNAAGTTLKGFSVAAQSGTQDPLEIMQLPASGANAPAVGDRIVVVLFSGATRALRVDTNEGRLSIATTGSTYGHNGGANTISMASTFWNSARTGTRAFVGGAPNPTENFSSDGPRRIFFNPNGTAITPGNFLFATGGGTVLQKPDFAAADGVSAKTPGFLPFYGTSAAAPHAAAIAALIRSARPDYTNAQVYEALRATALDTMAPGTDRDSGYGLIMAMAAVQYALTH